MARGNGGVGQLRLLPQVAFSSSSPLFFPPSFSSSPSLTRVAGGGWAEPRWMARRVPGDPIYSGEVARVPEGGCSGALGFGGAASATWMARMGGGAVRAA